MSNAPRQSSAPARPQGSALERHTSNSSAVTLELPEPVLDAIAERVAQLMCEREEGDKHTPWLTVEEAAERIRAPKSRLYALVSKRAIPFEKDGSRVLFHRDQLDQWVREGGATRP